MGLGGEQCCLRLDFSTVPAHGEHHHSLDTRSHSSAIAFSAGICPTCIVMVQGWQKLGAPRRAVGAGLGPWGRGFGCGGGARAVGAGSGFGGRARKEVCLTQK